MGAQYVVDENGERVSVILPIEVYERLIEELEELDDVKAAEEARREIETRRGRAHPVGAG